MKTYVVVTTDRMATFIEASNAWEAGKQAREQGLKPVMVSLVE